MPELPEVEVVRAGLAAHIIGARIDAVQVVDSRSLRRFEPGAVVFADLLTGRIIKDVSRRGKYLWLTFESEADRPDDALVIHLGMSGQVLLKEPDFPDEKHLKIRCDLTFADGQHYQLRFVDQRIFGGMFLDSWVETRNRAGELVPAASSSIMAEPRIPLAVAHIARDPLDEHFELADFVAKISKTSQGIKKLILDQAVISGVGNIYADEALWRVKMHYAKPGKSLSKKQAQELVQAITEVMQESLAQGGTSFDDLYVNVNGESGYFERGLNAYGRAGQPCKRCQEKGKNSIMVREPFGGRSSFRCTRCQRKPRGVI